jgi:hypothetical protein
MHLGFSTIINTTPVKHNPHFGITKLKYHHLHMNIWMLLSTCTQDGLRDFSIITVKYRTELRKTGWISMDIDVDCMQDTLEINGSFAGPYLRMGHRSPGPGRQISRGGILTHCGPVTQICVFCIFALQLWKTDDAKLPFNTRLVFMHLITQYMEHFLIWSSGLDF